MKPMPIVGMPSSSKRAHCVMCRSNWATIVRALQPEALVREPIDAEGMPEPGLLPACGLYPRVASTSYTASLPSLALTVGTKTSSHQALAAAYASRAGLVKRNAFDHAELVVGSEVELTAAAAAAAAAAAVRPVAGATSHAGRHALHLHHRQWSACAHGLHQSWQIS